MRWAALALVSTFLATPAGALDLSLEPYREARRAGALCVVSGRVAAEPRTPLGPVRPFAGATVTLLPRSEMLVAELERLREGARDSSKAFTAAAPAMRKAHEAYERKLLWAGAPDLTPVVLVDPGGGFKIEDVPAGAWVLIAWHSSPMDVSAAKPRLGRRDLYQPQSHLQGYQAVTVWLRELVLVGGTTTAVELTDRNGWFRGVVEDRVKGTSR
jgi:hypothetical protein